MSHSHVAFVSVFNIGDNGSKYTSFEFKMVTKSVLQPINILLISLNNTTLWLVTLNKEFLHRQQLQRIDLVSLTLI